MTTAHFISKNKTGLTRLQDGSYQLEKYNIAAHRLGTFAKVKLYDDTKGDNYATYEYVGHRDGEHVPSSSASTHVHRVTLILQEVTNQPQAWPGGSRPQRYTLD
jgi:hypothetical protein